MYHFCTITTYSHFYKTLALNKSLQELGHAVTLHVLCIDNNQPLNEKGVEWHSLNEVTASGVGKHIVEKYKDSKDKTRWSLKPVFLHYLLSEKKIEKIAYVDNDIFFFSDYSFLFDDLEKHSFLLTPHHYKSNPQQEQNWLEANFRVGLYNAGFVGVNKSALPHLQWWAQCCLYRCEKNPMRGMFDDQKYLDLIPVLCADTKILQHKGCNVADWNNEVCKRTEVNGEILINGSLPIVFIHFNVTTIRSIIDGLEPLLVRHWQIYLAALQQFKPGLSYNHLYSPVPATDKVKLWIWQLITRLGF